MAWYENDRKTRSVAQEPKAVPGILAREGHTHGVPRTIPLCFRNASGCREVLADDPREDRYPPTDRVFVGE